MIQLATFLFISGGEIFFILLIVVMVFGAKNIPDIAKGLGKGMRTIKHATNDLKSEITKSAERNGLDSSLTEGLGDDLKQIKDDLEDFTGSVRRKF